MRKIVLLFLIVLICVPALVGARDLFEIELGVSGLYTPGGSTDVEDFFQNMGDSNRWTVGASINTRLSLVNVSILAMVPTASVEQENILSLRSTLSFDIPLVTDRLYLQLGSGLSTDFSYENGTTDCLLVNSEPAEEMTFAEALTSSTIHMKFGVSTILGPAKLSMFYLLETPATIASLSGEQGWSQLVESTGTDRLGVMLQLALF